MLTLQPFLFLIYASGWTLATFPPTAGKNRIGSAVDAPLDLSKLARQVPQGFGVTHSSPRPASPDRDGRGRPRPASASDFTMLPLFEGRRTLARRSFDRNWSRGPQFDLRKSQVEGAVRSYLSRLTVPLDHEQAKAVELLSRWLPGVPNFRRQAWLVQNMAKNVLWTTHGRDMREISPEVDDMMYDLNHLPPEKRRKEIVDILQSADVQPARNLQP